ncbi:MAG TPA: YfaZ family outer membrane protein [Dongiaceae bacterium]|nr:YfaZ family outer membrane protein [Dongiaceae bacterium]
MLIKTHPQYPSCQSALLGLAFCTLAGVAQAHTVDLGINNDAVSLEYNNQIPKSELNLGVGGLHSKENGDAYYASLFVADNVNKESGLLAGLGTRFYYLDADEGSTEGTGLALGGFLNWDVPSVPNLSLRGDFYYAPDVLTFDDVENFGDVSARVQYRVIEQAWLYVGYRRLMLEDELSHDFNLEEGAFVGMLLWF